MAVKLEWKGSLKGKFEKIVWRRICGPLLEIGGEDNMIS